MESSTRISNGPDKSNGREGTRKGAESSRICNDVTCDSINVGLSFLQI